MAAGDSPTSIANLALGMLGEEPIVNVAPPDNNRAGRLCGQFYDPCRRAVLEKAPWRCAKKQALLANSVAMPIHGGFAFPLPADFIRMYELPRAGHREWERANLAGIGPCLVTRADAPLAIDYIFDLIDATQMMPLMVLALGAHLASSIGFALTRDSALCARCDTMRDDYVSAAQSVSAQEASPRTWDVDTLLRSRW